MMQLKSVLLLIVFCAVPVIGRTLQKGDPNTCETEMGKIESHVVRYKCKDKRGCTRQVKKLVTRKAIVCCAGWIFLDGVCVPEHPECDPPCINAKCTNTNICTCDSGLQRLNNTACAPPCPPDQYNDHTQPGFPCKYKCSQPCTNGVCVDIDQCFCNPGYKPKDQFNCEHKCTGCQHGTCQEPDYECKCHPGYTKNNDTKCEPVCDDCEHGSCIAPNDCGNCHEGYRKENNKCVPVCDEECQNGICTAPHYCTCDPFYSKDAENIYKCIPICENTCVNSTCVAPNSCQCLDGFETAGENWICRPNCKSCINGMCVAPDTCICKEGYEKNEEDVCIPICKSCKNGTCRAPNECECYEGYEKNEFKFEKGFQNNDMDDCAPVCKSCTNGVCIQPNVCECNPGYKMDVVLKICKPECNPGCVNGTCVGVDECECLSGYEKSNVSNVCQPACVSCANGDCVEPDVCRCHDGYELYNATCLRAPTINCFDCGGACKDGVCMCLDGSLCHQIESDVESTPTLAGFQLTWMLGGAVAILLVIVLTAIMVRMWRQRQSYDQKAPDNKYDAYGSVACTIDNRLVHLPPREPLYDDVELTRQTNLGLLDHTEDCVERL